MIPKLASLCRTDTDTDTASACAFALSLSLSLSVRAFDLRALHFDLPGGREGGGGGTPAFVISITQTHSTSYFKRLPSLLVAYIFIKCSVAHDWIGFRVACVRVFIEIHTRMGMVTRLTSACWTMPHAFEFILQYNLSFNTETLLGSVPHFVGKYCGCPEKNINEKNPQLHGYYEIFIQIDPSPIHSLKAAFVDVVDEIYDKICESASLILIS